MYPLELGFLNVANSIRVRAPSSPPLGSKLEFGGNKLGKVGIQGLKLEFFLSFHICFL